MPAASSISVVVADDQASMRSLIRNGLQQLGFADIRECSDGEDALKALVQRPAHLVLSDFNLPALDGIGLLRAARAPAPTRQAAFLLLTGRTAREGVPPAGPFTV